MIDWDALIQDTDDQIKAIAQQVKELEAALESLETDRDTLIEDREVFVRRRDREQRPRSTSAPSGEPTVEARIDHEPQPNPADYGNPGPAERDEWDGLSRVEIVLRALQSLGGPQGPAEIDAFLQTRGRTEGRDNISAALAHLRRRGHVHRTGQRQWFPGPADPYSQPTLNESDHEAGLVEDDHTDHTDARAEEVLTT